ncbi:N-acetyltransferase [Mongoliitalea lutea]|uniref:Uncharacterized protein n=1 Tax=Mongoliitalea lutea TaxID=849756 RepID=A0A8J3G4T9_9BACT|nr:N-acetyltransferase [Mongoliitalea lutea]GHB33238.1 hypothetical protein GCM10008106_12720 [Mongoliitalea lutea]
MVVVEVSTGKRLKALVLPVEANDFKSLNKSMYFFNWKEERGYEIYKLIIVGQLEILGLISFEKIPFEWRYHIRLLSASKKNVGKQKQYDYVIGNLLAHVGKIAVADFGEMACISLKPKTAIIDHYRKKYKMQVTGSTLSLEVPELINLINEYDHDEK